MSAVTPTSWARQLLGDEGLPQTASNLDAVVSWEREEGGAGPQWGNPNNTADYNPLNATQPEPGSHTVSGGPAAGAGVQAYPSWAEGLAATEQTLSSPDYGYPGILAALRAGNDPGAVEQAVVASSWGTGGFTVSNASSYNPSGTGSLTGGGGFDWNPLSWPGQIAGAVTGSLTSGFTDIAKTLVSWGLRITVTAFGLALIGVGADRALTGGKGATLVKSELSEAPEVAMAAAA